MNTDRLITLALRMALLAAFALCVTVGVLVTIPFGLFGGVDTTGGGLVALRALSVAVGMGALAVTILAASIARDL